VTGLLALGIRLYEPILGHLSYSLLPNWAIRLYGRRAYPATAATVGLRMLRRVALSIPGGVRVAGREPQPVIAVRRLGSWATPSPSRLPVL
jgi:hypothetical protein